MSTKEPKPLPTPPSPHNAVLHNAAIAGAVLCPLAMLLPPRKADLRSFVLFGSFSLCVNQLVFDYSGQSVYERFGNRVGSVFDTSLPQGAQRTQQLLKEQREREAAWRQQQQQEQSLQRDGKNGEEQGKKSGVLRDIWMGGEDEDWKKRRAEEHRKSFEEGKGMSDVIFDQVADVFSGRWRGEKKEKKEKKEEKDEDEASREAKHDTTRKDDGKK